MSMNRDSRGLSIGEVMQSVKKMWFTILWILIILIPSAGAQPRQVNMAIGGHFPMAAFHVATAKGYYKQENLEVNLVVMGASISNQALISGTVAFSAGFAPYIRFIGT
jgi:ABC-type nitrate/sulfonate/bicarbonate transport system substrate-binding protein